MRLNAVIHQEGDLFVAQCVEIDVASQGCSPDEAIANLREAVELRLEDVPEWQRPQPYAVTSFEIKP